MIRTVIIDDEDHIRDTLKKLLTQFCPQLLVEAETGDVNTGIRILSDLKPDLVFLDVHLSDGTGFDILQAFPDPPFRIIFITAFDQYAVKAFKFSAVDYLLKPVLVSDLVEAVNRAETMIRSGLSVQIKALEDNLKAVVGQKHKIILKSSESIHLVDPDEIIYCRSDDYYTWFYCVKGNPVLVSRTLKEFEEMLGDSGFYRVHKSFLVNLAHVVRFDKQDGGYVITTGNHRIPVATRKKDELLQVFERMSK